MSPTEAAQDTRGTGRRTDPVRGRRAVRPTGVERAFGPEEIIVSKTDPRGLVTYANDVFVRVSGYDEQQILGQPHNLIRHPAMPRAVFRLMWDVIPTGRELFAYVLNLAADGGHYWVLAHVTASLGPGGRVVGYHSNRRWVPPGTRRTVAELYARVRAAEDAHTRTPDALAAGAVALEAELARAGATYDELVWSLAGADDAVDAARPATPPTAATPLTAATLPTAATLTVGAAR
ncbi:PAS domain-containing protein [Cellulomonas hominis]|uniref:PAS domain-containing protein n=1 Tax=Cellulomonas hominis TaxID=156981 RepID=UPI001B8F7DF8|nr:PAS domain-containing protein [Cellulomonas hominis]VTR78076.1 Aerotaxis receptor [Cellulomonas hominis]